MLEAWVSAKYLDKATEKALRAAVAEKDNFKALGDRSSEKELWERFIRTLGDQEDRLVAIGKQEKKLQADRDAAKAKLADSIGGLELETDVPGGESKRG